MDLSVLWKLSYGMYAVGTLDEERPTGCIVNTVAQITSENPVIAVSMNRNNFTYEAMKKTGKFSISILSEQTNPNVIARLGFSSGRNADKFTGFHFMYLDGMPIVKENACGYLTAEIVGMHQVETHDVILGRVLNTMKGIDFSPMTYRYYHETVKGKAPKNAPTYQKEAQKDKYVCDVCGYVYEGDIAEMPKDYICPVCKQSKEHFRKM